MKESATGLCSAAPESHFLEEDAQEHRETADEKVKSELSAPFGVFRIFGKNSDEKKGAFRMAVAVILATLLIVQTFLIVHYGAKKSRFHIDEIFTFELSMTNSFGWYNKQEFLDKWLGGEIYYKFLRVNPENRFNYIIPYVNQVADVHPPLYYMAVHTMCSILPEISWKWIGLTINLFFSLLSTVFLYFLAKDLSDSDSFALFSTAFWAWSSGALSCAIFLRMYTMLTTWTILLALLHARFIKLIDNEEPIRKSAWIGLFLTTAAGILTQYYFLVFCFFLCGFTFLCLVWKKKYGVALRYVVTEFTALAVSYFVFPVMINHIFAEDRGAQALENFWLSKKWLSHFIQVTGIIYKQLFCAPLLPSILLLLLIFWILCKLSGRKKSADHGGGRSFLRLFLLAFLYECLISRIAPYQTGRYYFCIYPFFTVSVLYTLYKTGSLVLSKKLLAAVFIAVLVLELGVSLRGRYINYLYPWGEERERLLSNYLKFPAIVIQSESDKTAKISYLYEFEKFPVVYGCSVLESLKNVKENGGDEYLKNGFLVYAVGYDKGFRDRKFIQDISKYLPISKWKRIKFIKGCPVFLCRTEER